MAWYVVVTLAPRQILGMGCLLFMVAAHGESLRDPTQPEGLGGCPVIENPTTRPVVGSQQHRLFGVPPTCHGERRVAWKQGKSGGIELVKVERDQVMLKWQARPGNKGFPVPDYSEITHDV